LTSKGTAIALCLLPFCIQPLFVVQSGLRDEQGEHFMEQWERGVILGKFYPPHRGHLHLIEQARRYAKHITVIVERVQHETIPVSLRASWLKDLVPQNVHITQTDEIGPQHPHEHPDFWQFWANLIRRYCPAPEVIFTSEEYGEPLSQHLQCAHINIDLKRHTFPISATQVRANPYTHWNMLPPPVRGYYAKRIVVTGAESTGKTTLAANLALHFNTLWLPEYGREFVDRKGERATLADMHEIAREHLRREDELACSVNRVLICDTDATVTHILSQIYVGSCPAWITRESFERPYDLHLVTMPDIPYEFDPLHREGERMRQTLHEQFIQELERRHHRYVLISGSLEDRVAQATAAIEPLFDTVTAHPPRPLPDSGL
jgi:HTH-type transcriptional regulator, transcriptional repressor of NAD biosynthesis genes